MAQEKVDAYMPLWIGAYLADTLTFTTLQHGAYFLMLMAYWRERAPLPDDDDALRAITKLERADWKRVRPILAKKFKVADGVWWHKRVELELDDALQRKAKATAKAKGAAEARWGKDAKQSSSNARGYAGSDARSIPGGMHEESPTTSTTPPQGRAAASPPPPPRAHEAEPPEVNGHAPTPAGAICRAIRAAGFASPEVGDARLLALVLQGATEAEFTDAAKAATKAGKGWGWLLSRVEGRRADAAAIALAPAVTAPWHETRSGIVAKGVELGIGEWDQDAFDHGRGESFAVYTAKVQRAANSEGATA